MTVGHDRCLGAKQMCIDYICLEPSPDLEEEASVSKKFLR
jgi:hypothetical protein